MLTSWLSFLGLAGQSDETVPPLMATNCRLFRIIAVNPTATLGNVQQLLLVTYALIVHTGKQTQASPHECMGTQNRVMHFLRLSPVRPKVTNLNQCGCGAAKKQRQKDYSFLITKLYVFGN